MRGEFVEDDLDLFRPGVGAVDEVPHPFGKVGRPMGVHSDEDVGRVAGGHPNEPPF